MITNVTLRPTKGARVTKYSFPKTGFVSLSLTHSFEKRLSTYILQDSLVPVPSFVDAHLRAFSFFLGRFHCQLFHEVRDQAHAFSHDVYLHLRYAFSECPVPFKGKVHTQPAHGDPCRAQAAPAGHCRILHG